MPKKTLILNDARTALLSWNDNYNNVVVSQNNQEVFVFSDKAALAIGQKISLSDGDSIYVRLMNGDLEAWYNGHDLVSNLDSGGSDHFKTAYQTLWGIGAIQIIIGLFFILVFSNAKSDVSETPILILFYSIIPAIGLVNLGLGFWAQRKKTKLPLGIGIGLMCLFVITLNLYVLIMIVGICLVLYRGIQANIISYTDEERTIDENTPLDQI